MKKLIAVSGPRGAGKELIIKHILMLFPHLARLVNFTTRAPRTGETEGVEYYFIDVTKFLALRNTGKLACFSQIGKDDDKKRYFNGITKAEMEKHQIAIVDKAVKSARKISKHADKTLMLYIFARYDERLGRLQKGRGLDLESARAELENEVSPGEEHQIAGLYPDFVIVHNHDGRQDEACAQAAEAVRKFLSE